MPMSIKVGGTWRDIAAAGMLTRVSGTWRNVQTAYVRVSGTWRTFYQSDQAGPAAASGISAQFTSGSGTNVQVNWTNPADADMSFMRVTWFIGAPGSPVETDDVYGAASAAGVATFNTGSITSNVYIQLTPYDTSGNPGVTTQVNPSSIKCSAPQSFGVAAWSYTSLTVSWAAPAFGTANNYTVELRNQAGTLISSQTTGLMNATFTVAEDLKYQLYVIANSTGGSTSSAVLKPWIGHSELGYSQAIYGWSSSVSTIRPGDAGASTAAPGYPTSNLYDTGSGTQWRSAGTFGSEGPVYWECFRFYSPGGNRKLVSVTINGEANHKYYLGAQHVDNSWDGPIFPATAGIASSGFPFDAAQIYHDYLAESYEGYTTYVKVCDAESFALVLSNYQFFNVAITRLINDGANWKAVVSDVFISYKDWVQTGSTWVVTRTAQANTYW
jgi:hypothetical protein